MNVFLFVIKQLKHQVYARCFFLDLKLLFTKNVKPVFSCLFFVLIQRKQFQRLKTILCYIFVSLKEFIQLIVYHKLLVHKIVMIIIVFIERFYCLVLSIFVFSAISIDHTMEYTMSTTG